MSPLTFPWLGSIWTFIEKNHMGFESSRKLAYFERSAPKLKNHFWRFKKVNISKWLKVPNNISWVPETFFEPWRFRKQFPPIWMYIERFYENTQDRFSSNFRIACALRSPHWCHRGSWKRTPKRFGTLSKGFLETKSFFKISFVQHFYCRANVSSDDVSAYTYLLEI